MKSIGARSPEAEWNKRILSQLDFIKKNLRYPIDRRTALPVALLATSLPAFGFLFYTIFFTNSTSHYSQRWPIYLILPAILIPFIVTIRRYWQTLHFVAIPARRDTGSNMLLLRQFLGDHHFAFVRHPEAPEIFQIISRSIASLQDEREVVFFIAVEGRILVNSHFTQSGFRSSIGTPHYRQIARTLAGWIDHIDSTGQKGLQVF